VRILYLNPTASLGGAERILLAVMAAARDAYPSAALHLLLPGPGPLAQEAAELGVTTQVLPLPSELAALGDSGLRDPQKSCSRSGFVRNALWAVPAARRYARALAREVNGRTPDLIHSNGIKTHLLAWLAELSGAPIVWHVHDFYSTRPLVGYLLRWARRRAAHAIAVSHAVQRDVAGLLPTLPVSVVPNAIDVERFSPGPGAAAAIDALAGFPPAAGPVVRVGIVATFARWKGQDVFLAAAARVLKESPPTPVRFYIIGGPIYQTAGSQFSVEELRRTAHQLGLAAHVGFLGFVPNPVSCYRTLDVVVHASTRPEPFGLTIIEAMACARSVVAVSSGGAAELFTPGYDAVGVPPSDPAALAHEVSELVRDATRRRRLGEQARRTVGARFNTTRLPTQLREVYAKVLDKPDVFPARVSLQPLRSG
jgi:glycosyltransferase involved in cell wall biosynthesis